MGIASKLGLQPKEVLNKSEGEVTLNLTKGEVEALLIGLGEATFKGKQVESVYKLAVKLQSELAKMK